MIMERNNWDVRLKKIGVDFFVINPYVNSANLGEGSSVEASAV